MITEDYVNFDTAKLLKEKGFDWKCEHCYDVANDSPYSNANYQVSYPKPTLQMATKWLMENKGIAIIPILSSILDNEKFLWDIKIVVAKTGESYSQGWIYEKPEDAFDTAIKYCLENLI